MILHAIPSLHTEIRRAAVGQGSWTGILFRSYRNKQLLTLRHRAEDAAMAILHTR
jgi:hypothetical protein